MNSVKELYTLAQVAERLDVSTRTVNRWIKRGDFPPPLRVGKTPYYRKDVVRDYLDERSRVAAG